MPPPVRSKTQARRSHKLPRGLRVLLVEDDDDVRSVAQAFLRSMGCEVAACNSAEAALAELAAARRGMGFDLLFSDITLGAGIDGQELARRVDALYPALRVLLTSGYSHHVAGTGSGGVPLRWPVLRQAVHTPGPGPRGRAVPAGRHRVDVTALPHRYTAMALTRAGDPVLQAVERAMPLPGPGQLLLRVDVCGVCRTDLHIVDGELTCPSLPRVPGHEVVGTVAALGAGCRRFAPGARVGVPWLHASCGACAWCTSQRENLCTSARFTGFDVDGGYAEFMLAEEDFCFALPERYTDEQAAPLLCAGLIGWRALGMAGNARTLGLYGFGAAGHLVAQVALQQGRRVFAFTRPGDEAAQALARSLGVQWAGGSDEAPPSPIDGALLFAPVGALVPIALQHSLPGQCHRLRRHPHERYPAPALPAAVGRALRSVRRQPDTARRRGVLRLGRRPPAGQHHRAVRTARRQPGARPPAPRRRHGRRGAAHFALRPVRTAAWTCEQAPAGAIAARLAPVSPARRPRAAR